MENQDLFAAEMPSEKQPAQKKLVRRSAITDDAWRISASRIPPPMQPKSAKKTSSITSTACCTAKNTASATPTI
ncbi:hypothetical protein [Neisseria cinerea]|uniref:hypothetical protein n=1 Tax=Neisseria cinerea TaxID=483 RepID=UPI001F3C12E9|nr:hypothetical protein [Neisseria cinerea]